MSRFQEDEDEISIYSRHLAELLKCAHLWVRRRVVAGTVIDGDTLEFSVSLDYDLNSCNAGRNYLAELRGLPILIPIGLYPHPYVGFHLRGSGDSSMSLVPKDRRDKIARGIDRYLGFRDIVYLFTRKYRLEIAIAELTSAAEPDKGRGILHYTYLRHWRRDDQAFPFLPQPRECSPASLPWYGREWRRRLRMLLGWRPMRVTIPVWNAQLADSFHLEFNTPADIRIHDPGIFVGGKSGPIAVSEKPKDVPPAHNYAIVHYSSLPEEPGLTGKPLIFRSWLGIDRRGYLGVVPFLAIFNAFVSCASVATFAFARIDIAAVVAVQVLASAAVFAYLYVPAEHSLLRGLYTPIRSVLVTIAAAGLTAIGALSFAEKNYPGKLVNRLPALGALDLSFFAIAAMAAIVTLIGTLMLWVTWWKARDSWIDEWVRDNSARPQYGWHSVG